ncbi:MAG: DUF4097 family beta strand repeat-containing protein [Clostridiales bacterium]|nr:DUF4097 family beta strand repeat-containing protein [Clostridiales bacterium]
MHRKQVFSMVLAAFVVLYLAAPSAQAEHQEEFTKVLPLSSKGTFSLSNVNGSVVISTWKDEKVEIRALKRTKRSAENLEKVKIEIEATANSVSVKTIYPKRSNTGVSVYYEVKAPEGVNLDKVSTVNGKVRLTGPFGRVLASAVNGGVSAENASGDLSFSTTNGSVEAANIRGGIDANTVNGSISLEVGTVEEGIRAKTVNGGITLRLASAESLNADFFAKTVNGGISVDFPISFQNLSKTRHKLEGQIGKGGPEIYVQTVNGSIHLTR